MQSKVKKLIGAFAFISYHMSPCTIKSIKTSYVKKHSRTIVAWGGGMMGNINYLF